MTRGQANLLALAVALLGVSATAGIAFSLADATYAANDRDAIERATTNALADRLVRRDAPFTTDSNVIDADRLDGESPSSFESSFPSTTDVAVRLRLADETVLDTGVTDGTTVRRVVLVAREQRTTVSARVGPADQRVTVPRRTDRVAVDLDRSMRVTAVRVNGRVALLNESGLDGRFTVETSPYQTTTLTFEGDPVMPGHVAVTAYPTRTTKAVLAVTVDA